MQVTRILLYPFSLLYGTIMAVRNSLYDRRYFTSTSFALPVISIGNLTVGGTGKTPHVEYLLRLLRNKKVATLSRGYKRQSKGYVLANASASAATLGDEPFQYYQDFPGVTVAVSEDRAAGIQQLLLREPSLEAIILDDAYQHRGVVPSLNILLTDYARLFYEDLVLPAGRLREFPVNANRADAIVVTKCARDILPEQMEKIKIAIYRFVSKSVPVFFTRYEYATPVACGLKEPISRSVLLITAIANPQPLEQYLLDQGYQVLQHYRFPDHHAYTAAEMQKIFSEWQRYSQKAAVSIVTTRKDAVKLTEPGLAAIWRTLPFFYLPVRVVFVQDQFEFDALILNHLASKSKPENN